MLEKVPNHGGEPTHTGVTCETVPNLSEKVVAQEREPRSIGECDYQEAGMDQANVPVLRPRRVPHKTAAVREENFPIRQEPLQHDHHLSRCLKGAWRR